MFPDKLLTALMSGCSDSLTPPFLASAALLGLFIVFCREQMTFSFRVLPGFLLGHFCVALFLRCGALHGRPFVEMSFQNAALFYSGVGIVLVFIGSYFAYLWVRQYIPCKGNAHKGLFKIGPIQPWVSGIGSLIGLFAGSVMALFSYQWPVHTALLTLMGDAFMPGLLWSTVWCLVVYEGTFVVLVTLLCLTLRYFLGSSYCLALCRKRSLLLSVLAAMTMSLGFGLIRIFVQLFL